MLDVDLALPGHDGRERLVRSHETVRHRDALVEDYWSTQPRFRFVKNLPLNARLLDFGAGSGGVPDWLRWQNPARDDVAVFAIDIVDHPNFARYAGYEILDVSQRPSRFSYAFFTSALCAFVLERVANVRAALRELARVVAPGGKLYIEFIGATATKLPRASELATYGMVSEALNFYEDVDLKTIFDVSTLSNELAIAGFRTSSFGIIENERLAPELLTYGKTHADRELTTYALRLLYGHSSYIIADRIAACHHVDTQ